MHTKVRNVQRSVRISSIIRCLALSVEKAGTLAGNVTLWLFHRHQLHICSTLLHEQACVYTLECERRESNTHMSAGGANAHTD